MSVRLARHIRFARALHSRPFALVWAGQAISAFGDGAFYTALAWQVLLVTGSTTAMGIVLVGESGPRLVVLLLGGVVADRLSHRRVLLWSDAGRAVFVLLIGALGWFHLLRLWHLVALSALFGVVDGFFTPAYRAITPQFVPRESLPSANALIGLAQQTGLLVGPVLGAACIALAGPPGAFGFDGLTFVVSTLCLLGLGQPSARVDQCAPDNVEADSLFKPPVRHIVREVIADARAGLAYVIGSTWLWTTVLVAAGANVGLAAPTAVALPKLVRDVYHAGVWLLGVLGTANACGVIVATVVVGQARRLRRRGLLAYLALLGSGIALLSLGLPHPHANRLVILVSASGAYILAGFGVGFFSVIWTTLLQERVPSDKLGRVTSIDLLGSYALLPVGFVLAGAVGDRVGPGWVFIAGGGLTATLACIALCIRSVRSLD